MKDVNQKFYHYCQNNLTVVLFNSLPTKLGITSNMVTKYLKNPSKMPKHILEAFSRILGMLPEELIRKFHAGLDALSAREFVGFLDIEIPEIEAA